MVYVSRSVRVSACIRASLQHVLAWCTYITNVCLHGFYSITSHIPSFLWPINGVISMQGLRMAATPGHHHHVAHLPHPRNRHSPLRVPCMCIHAIAQISFCSIIINLYSGKPRSLFESDFDLWLCGFRVFGAASAGICTRTCMHLKT